MRAIHVLVLLTNIDASDPRTVVVDHVRLLRQVDELVRVRLEQPPRIAWWLAMGKTIVLDLAKVLLLPPALLVGCFVCRCAHAFANLTLESRSWRVDEHVHVGVAGRHPQTVPTRHGSERLLRAPLCLGQQVRIVIVGRREWFRRRLDFKRRPIAAAERSRLRERNRRYDTEREYYDCHPAQAFV